MIAITSIAPGHKNFMNQFVAVNSWHDMGFNVVSMNRPEEIKQLRHKFPDVVFVPTLATMEHVYGKPNVTISAMMEYLQSRGSSHVMIINSDIIIYDSWDRHKFILDNATRGVVVLSRYDFDEEYKEGKKFQNGFDAFVMDRNYLSIFPETQLCMGQCFWDYWLPYQAVLNKVPIFKENKAYIFHKRHETQYSAKHYQIAGETFRKEVSAIDPSILPSMDMAQMSHHVFNRIMENLK